jgi:hypothetical protein
MQTNLEENAGVNLETDIEVNMETDMEPLSRAARFPSLLSVTAKVSRLCRGHDENAAIIAGPQPIST